jgi:hypothetical protein
MMKTRNIPMRRSMSGLAGFNGAMRKRAWGGNVVRSHVHSVDVYTRARVMSSPFSE